jgi:tetratricopeptide (TPR) repeat protein
VFFCLSSVDAALDGAVLRRIRAGHHSKHARIVMEIEGARPTAVGPLSDLGFPITFEKLKSQVRPKTLSSKWPSPVSNISVEERDGATIVWIGFGGAVSVEQNITAKSRTAYHLILDCSPQSTGADSPLHSGLAAAPREHPTTNHGSQAEPSASTKKPSSQGPTDLPSATQGEVGSTEDPFMEVDSLYAEHSEHLPPMAAHILEGYRAALSARPNGPQAPLAQYRSGLCHLALGNGKKAEEAFKQVLSNHSQHAVAPLAWLGLGQALVKRQAYMEAVQALRTALNGPLDATRTSDAYYFLGMSFHRMGAFKEVLEALSKSLENNPTEYVRQPELLRLLGESYFADQQYDKSANHLLWYLNIEKEVREKDLILAKIGESLMYTGNQDLAKKVYIYIDKYLPETEGYIISKIRRAEYFEKQIPPNKVASSAIYEELSQHSIAGPMGEYLTYKIALWERERKNYEQSLAWIEKGLHNSSTPKAKDELTTLKVKALLDYLKDTHDQQDYSKVLQLYQDNETLLAPHTSLEVLRMLAQSCAALKLYPAAAKLYHELYTKSGSKNDEWLLEAAKSYLLMGDMERAQQACQPVQGEVFQTEKAVLLGQVYFAKGKYKEAAQELSKYVQKMEGGLGDADPDMLFSYAESLMHSDRNGEALSFLERLTKEPLYGEGEKRFRIGIMQSRCYHKLKQDNQTTRILEHLLTLSPPQALRDRINYELSQVYREMGQPQKATEKLTELSQSSDSLWNAAAQQELGYFQLQSGSFNKGSN